MSQQYFYDPFGNSSDVYEARNAYLILERKKKEQKKEIKTISMTMAFAIIAYLVIQTISSSALIALNLTELYYGNPLFKYAFNILAISICSVALPFGLMALVNKKKYVRAVIPNQPVKKSVSLAWVLSGVFCCVLSNFLVSYISVIVQTFLGLKLTQGSVVETPPDSVFACVLELIALAIVPAICEEFAMRCCSLQLLSKYGKGFSIFAVSIVFGLLHGNIVQFIFAFFVGLVLGYVTVQTNNIMPAIFIHFINNGVSVVQDIVGAYVSDDTASSAVVIIYGVFAVLGIASLVYLAIKKQFKMIKNDGDDVLSNGAKFSAFLFPWMVVPFLILILLTATTIEKA